MATTLWSTELLNLKMKRWWMTISYALGWPFVMDVLHFNQLSDWQCLNDSIVDSTMPATFSSISYHLYHPKVTAGFPAVKVSDHKQFPMSVYVNRGREVGSSGPPKWIPRTCNQDKGFHFGVAQYFQQPRRWSPGFGVGDDLFYLVGLSGFRWRAQNSS